MNSFNGRLSPIRPPGNSDDASIDQIFRRAPSMTDTAAESDSGSERRIWSAANPNNHQRDAYADSAGRPISRPSTIDEVDRYVPQSRSDEEEMADANGRRPQSSAHRVAVAGSSGQQATSFAQVKYFDYNFYAVKKSVSSALLDVALLMANASQLKSIVALGTAYKFYWPMLILLIASIVLQVIVGCVIIWLSRVNINDADDDNQSWAEKLNNFIILGIFILTVVNVFVAAIGISAADTYNPDDK